MDGVRVGEPSTLRRFMPVEEVERHAAEHYLYMRNVAIRNKALAPRNHPNLLLVRLISWRSIPFAERFNSRARDWNWEVSVIRSDQPNAFCMAGGKIVVHTALLHKPKLSDDELAMALGHEIAHALREHGREQASKNMLTEKGANGLSIVTAGMFYGVVNTGANLLSLAFSRSDETDADLVGLDLAARAGYDPRAGITLWQKMAAVTKDMPPQWLSTHPSWPNRIKVIEQHLDEAMPLYEKTKKRRVG